MRRRGLTILELLIVIALLLGVAALVAPAIGDRMDERAFAEASDEIRSQLLLMRLEAMTLGTPLEVRFEPDPARITAHRFDPKPLSIERLATETDAEGSDFALDEFDLESEPHMIAEDDSVRPVVVHVLPDGMLLHRNRPTGESPDLEFAVADGAGAAIDPLFETSAPLRIAVFLPDGSVLLAPHAWILDDEGRVAMLSFNRWTGMASVTRADPIAESLDEDADHASDADRFEISDTDDEGAHSDEGGGGDRNRAREGDS